MVSQSAAAAQGLPSRPPREEHRILMLCLWGWAGIPIEFICVEVHIADTDQGVDTGPPTEIKIRRAWNR
jgi:hypothetical protein